MKGVESMGGRGGVVVGEIYHLFGTRLFRLRLFSMGV